MSPGQTGAETRKENQTVTLSDHKTVKKGTARRPPSSGRLAAIITASAFLLLALLAWTGCSGNSQTADTPASTLTGSKVTLKAKDPVTKEAVTKMVTRKVGSVDYAGDPIIRDIKLTPDGQQGTFVDINVGRPPSCHPGQVVGYITEMSRGFMSSLFLYPDVTKVQVTLYGTTEDAASKDVMAARALMVKADADKISDWFKFDENTIGSLCTEYWVEPDIYANWQKYGSTAITDPALLEQANQ